MDSNKERDGVIAGVIVFVLLLGGIVAAWYFYRSRGASELTEVPSDTRRATARVRPNASPPRDRPGTLMSFRGRNGESMLFAVSGAEGHTIWGTDIYTDDSPLAVAAVHAGALKVGEEGVIRVTILPGRDKYEGSTRSGVTSSAYEKWEGSYQLERVTGPTSQPVLPMPAAPAAAPSPGVAADTAALGRAARPTTRRAVGEVYRIEVVGTTEGSLWGTDVYTDDSTIGLAAVHAGLLAPGEHGTLRVTVREGRASYQGSQRNGVSSQPYGKWDGSFALERVDAATTAPGL